MKLVDANIVFIGGFNPNIIQPMWLSKHDVVEEKQEPFKVEIQVDMDSKSKRMRFDLDGFNWQVSEDRIQIASDKAISPVPMCIRLFELLPHTPIRAVGMNFRFLCDRKSWTQPIPAVPSSESIVELLGDSVSSSLMSHTKRKDGTLINLTMSFTEAEAEIGVNIHRGVSDFDMARQAMGEFDTDLDSAKKICIAVSDQEIEL